MPYHGPLASPGIRHNLALPEVVWSGLLMAYFLIELKKPKFVGWTTLMYGLTYMPTRILLDFIRVSERTYLGLTPAQYVAIAAFILCLFVYRWRRRTTHLLIPNGEPHRLPDGRIIGPQPVPAEAGAVVEPPGP
jgi:prolipoprotein diacylglyceryltransferase